MTYIWIGLAVLAAVFIVFVYALCVAASRGDQMHGVDDPW